MAVREDKTYHLRVVAANDWISYYVNDELVANLGDYTVQRNDMGQKNGIVDGHFGILNWNGEMLFQNTYFTPLADNELPFIDELYHVSFALSIYLCCFSAVAKSLQQTKDV